MEMRNTRTFVCEHMGLFLRMTVLGNPVFKKKLKDFRESSVNFVYQRSCNYSPQAKSSLPLGFVNQNLKQCSHVYSFAYHLWPLSCQNGRVELLQQRLYSSQCLKHYLLALYRKKQPTQVYIKKDILTKSTCKWHICLENNMDTIPQML